MKSNKTPKTRPKRRVFIARWGKQTPHTAAMWVVSKVEGKVSDGQTPQTHQNGAFSCWRVVGMTEHDKRAQNGAFVVFGEKDT